MEGDGEMGPPSGLGLTTWLVGTFAAIAVYYLYNSTINHYWKTKNVSSDNPIVFLGMMAAVLKGKTIFDLDSDQYRRHGRVCGLYLGWSPMLLLSDPKLLRMIFVKDFKFFPMRRVVSTSDSYLGKMLHNLTGEDWKRMRTIISPVFTSGKMRKLAQLVNRSAETITECFLESADSNQLVDLKRLFGGFTLDTIASTAFGTELNSIRNPDNIFVVNARKILNTAFNWRTIPIALAPKFMAKFGIGFADPQMMSFFAELMLKIREQRINGVKVREDFLQMLLEIESLSTDEKEDQDDNYYGTERENVLPSTQHFRKSLTRDELVAQCIVFFLAGYDTTGTTLTLVGYLLALNPECQDRLRKEVDEVWENHEGKIDFDAVISMKYLEAVVAETLRMYPPNPRLERKCAEDFVLGDTGITIPKDMYVGIPVYAMHRDPEFFPDPDTFNPDRFLPENKDSIKPYTYFPFGAGPRNCIAMRFALMEIKICLVHVMRHVSFLKCPQTKVPPEYHNALGMIQPKEIIVGLERRPSRS